MIRRNIPTPPDKVASTHMPIRLFQAATDSALANAAAKAGVELLGVEMIYDVSGTDDSEDLRKATLTTHLSETQILHEHILKKLSENICSNLISQKISANLRIKSSKKRYH